MFLNLEGLVYKPKRESMTLAVMEISNVYTPIISRTEAGLIAYISP